jgi:hypothetical protein
MAVQSFEDFPELGKNGQPDDPNMNPNKPTGATIESPMPPLAGEHSGQAPTVQDTPLPPPGPTQSPLQQSPVAPAPGQEKPSRAEQRISKLIGQRNERDEQLDLLRQELALVRDQNQLLMERTSRPAPSMPAPAPTTIADGQSSFMEHGQSSGHQPVSGLQHDPAFNQQLQPVLDYIQQAQERDRQQAEIAKIQTAQRDSLNTAYAEFPELRDPRTRLYQIADQIMREDPHLARSPNGPYQAALMANGALAGEARDGLHADEVRQAAATVDRQSGAGNSGTPAVQGADYQAHVGKLVEDNSFSAWNAARKAQRAAAGIPEPQEGDI